MRTCTDEDNRELHFVQATIDYDDVEAALEAAGIEATDEAVDEVLEFIREDVEDLEELVAETSVYIDRAIERYQNEHEGDEEEED